MFLRCDSEKREKSCGMLGAVIIILCETADNVNNKPLENDGRFLFVLDGKLRSRVEIMIVLRIQSSA